MKAPIPSRNSFWWNDTDGTLETMEDAMDDSMDPLWDQSERWWNDAMLDQKAARLLAHHSHRVRYAPWFMESETNVSETTGPDAPWLSQDELQQLRRRETFEVYFAHPTKGRMSTSVPLALLISYSRRAKETYFYKKVRGSGGFLEMNNWEGYRDNLWLWKSYVGCFWWKGGDTNTGRFDTEERRIRGQVTDMDIQVWEATRIFFDWMKTGKVVREVDDNACKGYLLDIARALGAPLFRAAILESYSGAV